eukprot:scaffold99510_cov21-Prasinocladus_malaysianus.AAC.1
MFEEKEARLKTARDAAAKLATQHEQAKDKALRYKAPKRAQHVLHVSVCMTFGAFLRWSLALINAQNQYIGQI